MGHRHNHAAGGGHGHSHGVAADADRGKLTTALLLLGGLMVVEVVVGVVANSLALITDAGHMLTDTAAIALSLLALRLAARPARGALTYGLKRVEIMSAHVNGTTLVVLGLLFTYEAIRRLISPPHVEAGLMLAVALAGIVVNLAATWTLARANRERLNVEGSFQHVLTDLYAFAGTAVAAAVILRTGWDRADAVATLLVAALMLRSGIGLLRASGRVFLEAAPAGSDPDVIGRRIAAVPGVVEIHDLHVWEITSGFPALSAHVVVGPDGDCHGVRHALERVLADEFAIGHTTLQVDHAPRELLTIGAPADCHARADGAATAADGVK